MFFFGGGNGSICGCHCFQEPYLETGRGKVHFSQLFSKIADRQNLTGEFMNENSCNILYIELPRAKSEALFNIYNLLKQNIKSC